MYKSEYNKCVLGNGCPDWCVCCRPLRIAPFTAQSVSSSRVISPSISSACIVVVNSSFLAIVSKHNAAIIVNFLEYPGVLWRLKSLCNSVKISCELLSFFVPLGWFTAITSRSMWWVTLWIAFVLCTFGLIYSYLAEHYTEKMLWIAFVLCTFGLIYSNRHVRCGDLVVVNCFRSLYLWVDLQRGG